MSGKHCITIALASIRLNDVFMEESKPVVRKKNEIHYQEKLKLWGFRPFEVPISAPKPMIRFSRTFSLIENSRLGSSVHVLVRKLTRNDTIRVE